MKINKKVLSVLFVSSVSLYPLCFSVWIGPLFDEITDINPDPNKPATPVCYIKNSSGVITNFYSLERAFEKAQSGDTVYAIPGTNPVLRFNSEIKSGVTFILPIDGENYDIKYENVDFKSVEMADNFPETFRKNLLTIEKGVILDVKGKLILGGSGGSTFVQGGTCSNYCEILMKANSQINVYGTFECKGFVKENIADNNSQINVFDNGKIYMPVVIYDWESASTALKYIGANVFFSNTFDFPNINVKINTYYGATLYGKFHLWGSSFLMGHKITEAIVIGSNCGFISMDSPKSHLSLKFNDTSGKIGTSGRIDGVVNHKIILDVYGKCSINNVEVKVTVTINTADYYLPISNIFDIRLHNAECFVPYKVKFLPGSRIFIDSKSSITFNENTMFYQGNIGNDGTSKMKNYNVNQPSQLICNGELNFNKGFGGKIEFDPTLENNGTIITGSNFTSITDCNEYIGAAKPFNFPCECFIKNEGEETPTYQNLLAGKKYINNGTYWENNGQSYEVVTSFTQEGEGTFEDISFTASVTDVNGNTKIYTDNMNINVMQGDKFALTEITGADKIVIGEEIFTFEQFSELYKREFVIQGNLAIQMYRKFINNEIHLDDFKLSVDNANQEGKATYNFTLELDPITAEVNEQDIKWSIVQNNGNAFDNLVVSTLDKGVQTAKVSSKDEDGTATVLVEAVDKYKSKVIAHSVDIKNTKKGCYAKDTLILMGSGEYKKIQDVSVGEQIMVINHDTGYLEIGVAAYIFKNEETYQPCIKLHFTNGATIEVLYGHCFFNLEELKYIELREENVNNYIGKHFYFYDNDKKDGAYVQLKSYEMYDVYSPAYAIVSAYHMNCIANGFVNITDDITGLYNYFIYDKNLKYIYDLKRKDIEAYGLYTYEERKDYFTPQEFELFAVKFLKISVAKGIIQRETIIDYVNEYFR